MRALPRESAPNVPPDRKVERHCVWFALDRRHLSFQHQYSGVGGAVLFHFAAVVPTLKPHDSCLLQLLRFCQESFQVTERCVVNHFRAYLPRR